MKNRVTTIRESLLKFADYTVLNPWVGGAFWICALLGVSQIIFAGPGFEIQEIDSRLRDINLICCSWAGLFTTLTILHALAQLFTKKRALSGVCLLIIGPLTIFATFAFRALNSFGGP